MCRYSLRVDEDSFNAGIRMKRQCMDFIIIFMLDTIIINIIIIIIIQLYIKLFCVQLPRLVSLNYLKLFTYFLLIIATFIKSVLMEVDKKLSSVSQLKTFTHWNTIAGIIYAMENIIIQCACLMSQ